MYYLHSQSANPRPVNMLPDQTQPPRPLLQPREPRLYRGLRAMTARAQETGEQAAVGPGAQPLPRLDEPGAHCSPPSRRPVPSKWPKNLLVFNTALLAGATLR